MVLRGADYDAITFDVYGTVLNWEPEIANFFQAWAADVDLETSKLELLEAYDRARQPLQSKRPAVRYPEILMQTYDAVVSSFGHEPDRSQREAFGRIAEAHHPFTDSLAALTTLRSTGFILGALSNIDDNSFKRVTASTGLAFDFVVTAERVGAYKPDHAHFWAALSDLLAMGISPERVLHVAQSRRADIVPANTLGLTCVWVNRPGHIFGRLGQDAETAIPDAEVSDLASLVSLLA